MRGNTHHFLHGAKHEMTQQVRSKLSIAFAIYNRARATARRAGDTKQIDILNKTLGRMIAQAYRH